MTSNEMMKRAERTQRYGYERRRARNASIASTADDIALFSKANSHVLHEGQDDGLEVPSFLDRRKRDQEKAPKQPSWRDIIKVHPAADLFPMMSREELLVLGEDIKQNGLKQSVVLWRDESGGSIYPETELLLLDGRNRLDAMELVGLPTVKDGHLQLTNNWAYAGTTELSAVHKGGTMPHDPWMIVVSANLNRRHLKPEDKDQIIASLLRNAPEKSNRQIASLLMVDHHKVAKVRSALESTGETSPVEKTIGKDGKARTAKPQRAKPTKDHRALLSVAPPEPISSESDHLAFIACMLDAIRTCLVGVCAVIEEHEIEEFFEGMRHVVNQYQKLAEERFSETAKPDHRP